MLEQYFRCSDSLSCLFLSSSILLLFLLASSCPRAPFTLGCGLGGLYVYKSIRVHILEPQDLGSRDYVTQAGLVGCGLYTSSPGRSLCPRAVTRQILDVLGTLKMYGYTHQVDLGRQDPRGLHLQQMWQSLDEAPSRFFHQTTYS